MSLKDPFIAADYVQDGKLTPAGIAYLLQFKQINFFSKTGTALLFSLCLPLIIPLAIIRLVSLFAVFGAGIFLKKYLSISLDSYPKLVSVIYFVCLGVVIRSRDNPAPSSPGAVSGSSDEATVIVSNHNSRFDAVLLAHLHQGDATYLASARTSFFGKLLIDSGLCSRAMEEGIALDTKEGRQEWRRRLSAANNRPLLFFPEGRVVHPPKTIITFQNHLLQGQKVTLVCKTSCYKSYFLDHSQIEMPFYKAPYVNFKHKRLWDSIVEGMPFFIAFVTIFRAETIGTIHLQGSETLEAINDSLYALYRHDGYRLVSLERLIIKDIMRALYL